MNIAYFFRNIRDRLVSSQNSNFYQIRRRKLKKNENANFESLINISKEYTVEQLSKARKSTNSDKKNTGNDEEMKIIEKCFSENISETEAKGSKKNEINYENVIIPEYYKLTKCEKCSFIISKIFNDENGSKKELSGIESKLRATTSKLEEEKLAQKVEIVDETPHVEAHPPKIEGFNVTPRVLGQGSCTLEMSKRNYQNDSQQQLRLDELAKRCMGAPVDEMDKVIIQELKNISQNSVYPKLDMDLVRNQCIESDKQNIDPTRFEKILPLHLDSTPLFALDSSSIVANDYKNSSLIRDYPTIVLTADVDEHPSDTPAPLSPYEKPAIPFYEYINKENIKHEEDSKMESAAVSETVDETEIIINEETLQKDVIPPQPLVEGEALHPKPNINQFTEPKTTQTNFIKDSILRIFNTQRVFSSNPDQPMDWHMTGQQYQYPQQQDETPNSSISSAHLPGGNRRTLDLPVNTAISANQNPEEYYSMSLPEEYITENQTTPVQRIFAECPVTQNIFYSALPQVELEEIPKRTKSNLDNALSQKHPLSHMIMESDAEQESFISNKVATEANLTESAKKSVSNSCSETIPLSLLLKKIREHNRLEYCRNLIAKAQIEIEGTKKFSCPPPLDKSKPKTSVKPCQPKPKPKCKPCPEPCPAECPTKKDPCAKFLPIFLSAKYIYTMTYEDLTPKELLNCSKGTIKLNSVQLLTEDIVKRIKEMGEKLKLIDAKDDMHLNSVEMYARDFEPWIPIPSWPIPKKKETKPFVCPKEGCKLPAARTNRPCKEKQCDGMSKKSFASELFSSPTINN